MAKNRKNKMPVLDSDYDFLKAFFQENPSGKGESEHLFRSDFNAQDTDKSNPDNPNVNKHGLPVLENIPGEFRQTEEESEENFKVLLEASLKKPVGKRTKPSASMPLKKRLKRYPGPEKELDLHGFNALGASVKAKSFIINCRHQGYFTLRIIVGKGLHSDLGPVLPDVIEDLLNTLKKDGIVLSFQWDRKKKSRSGAVIVYIRQFND